jgi:hypothetical protein
LRSFTTYGSHVTGRTFYPVPVTPPSRLGTYSCSGSRVEKTLRRLAIGTNFRGSSGPTADRAPRATLSGGPKDQRRIHQFVRLGRKLLEQTSIGPVDRRRFQQNTIDFVAALRKSSGSTALSTKSPQIYRRTVLGQPSTSPMDRQRSQRLQHHHSPSVSSTTL